ncbi:MAG: hypothetical protein WC824_05805 [Bacteroidota bacterium]
MNSSRIVFSTLVLALFLIPSLSFGQGNEGTIESSWNRPSSAPAERVVSPPRAVVKSSGEDMDYSRNTWDRGRSESSRPWPKLSSNPTTQEYYDVNTAVIDSLSHLYCLSSNYIGTLRIRNQQAMQMKDPQMRQFAYDGKPVAASSGQPSLQALHKELMQLLDRCLVGR